MPGLRFSEHFNQTLYLIGRVIQVVGTHRVGSHSSHRVRSPETSHGLGSHSYWKNGTHSLERTQDSGPYEDQGFYEDPGPVLSFLLNTMFG